MKIHRTLASDDAKALRMVEQAFKKGSDVDDDPERALLETMKRKVATAGSTG